MNDIESDPNAELRDRIRQKAAARAEATLYSLNNPYLSQEDKMEVELWFQFPGNVSLVTMLACLVYSSYVPLSLVPKLRLGNALEGDRRFPEARAGLRGSQAGGWEPVAKTGKSELSPCPAIPPIPNRPPG